MEKSGYSYVIGIDIGTGSTKAVAMTADGKVLSTAQHYYDSFQPKPGFSEQDPETIWKAFTQTVATIITTVEEPPACICLSSQMHGLLVLDKEDKALTPLITWADSRSAAIAEELRSMPIANEIYTANGTPIHSMSPLCKIMWLQKFMPHIFKEAAKFISIKEYIWFRLFGVFEIDHSVASGTGLFNTLQRNWNDKSLALAGISTKQLSTLVATNLLRTNLNSDAASLLTFSTETAFCIGATDGCLANVGSYALEEGIAAVTVGTSGAVRIATIKPLLSSSAMLFNYVLDSDQLISGGAISNGGNILQWLQQNFMSESQQDYSLLFKKVADIPAGSEGLLCLPYLHGERAPYWDEKASGIFFGITAKHTQSHFLRAGLEGVCYALQSVLNSIEDQGIFIKQLNVSGGFVHSPTWLQMLADITGKKLCNVQEHDASAVGAAMLGMKAMRIINDLTSIKPSQQVFIEPNPSYTEMYAKYYQLFASLYQTLKAPMHQLYQLNH